MNGAFGNTVFMPIMLVLALLSGCGGGGGDGASSSVPVTQGTTPITPTTSVQTVKVTVDSTVPRQAAQKISNFFSVAGASDAAGQLPLPAAKTNEDHLVLGSDERNPYLLGFSAGNTALSAETTATALVRIALGGIRPADIKVDELNFLIKSTASYPVLVQNINTQLTNGITPLESKAVIESTWTTANEATAALRSFKSTLASSATKAASTVVVQSLPYDIISSGVRDKVWLDDPVGNDVTLKNRTVLSWAATYTLQDGATATSLIDGRQETYAQLLAAYSDSESSTNIAIPSDKFKFVLSQKRVGNIDPVSVNGLRATQRFIALLLSNLPESGPISTQCIINFGTSVYNDKLPALFTQQTLGAAKDYIVTGLGLGSPIEFATFMFNNYVSCTNQGLLNKEFFMLFFEKTTIVFKSIYLARDVVNSFDMVSQFYRYYDAEYPLEVCQNISNVPGAKGDCGAGGFFMGTAQMNSCIGAGGGIDYCNFLTYNLNKPEVAKFSFRVGNEPLNIRVDQQFGCIGATSAITQQAGSRFSYALSSEVPLLNPSVLDFRVDFADDKQMSGGIVVKYQIRNPDLSWSERTATGSWTATKVSQPFPKCRLPVPQGTPSPFDPPPFFCSTSSNVQRGCNYLPLSAAAREGEWLTQPLRP